ncbi:hypothetical protein TVAG_453370 [Trichomonas vaginalis G3]|uniref:Uncharacterized protein n=1 Tax=Trichomonas vaginalis (strain ATCC PRA-98 / G3) TaxID=412133 RepID=A2ES82_TRIV3|nr:hypothetical protein TVAGG3_0612020 [Trichomonas vaginalis G3]EAY04519.1 hypothetical protein TVAG_453370 [Trichomonas vaginalis G3]KAI5503255.1 hypothetical protein TVAGG3_0612020 [Trichomonas vaginalis G3]|eukprot:XP_001316742.1 hypothetical protein [Trichomonas vaginalis G3]
MQQRGKATIQNTLPMKDVMKYKSSDWYFSRIQTGKTVNIVSGRIPVYLAFSLSNTAGIRDISLELTDASDTIKDDFEIIDTNIPSLATEPDEEEEEEVDDGDNDEDPIPSSSSESSSATEEPSSEISVATPQPRMFDSTPFMTPDETWDGGWNDPPNVIVRGNDVPEIHETHPPIQTKYIKTNVPKVTKIINVTAGTGVIVVVVVLTVINIVRTFHRIKSHKVSAVGSNSDFSDMDLDVYSSPEYVVSDDNPFVLK